MKLFISETLAECVDVVLLLRVYVISNFLHSRKAKRDTLQERRRILVTFVSQRKRLVAVCGATKRQRSNRDTGELIAKWAAPRFRDGSGVKKAIEMAGS